MLRLLPRLCIALLVLTSFAAAPLSAQILLPAQQAADPAGQAADAPENDSGENDSGSASEPGGATALAPLLEVLRDDAARAELIAELEKLREPPTLAEQVDDIVPDATEKVSLGRRIALLTQEVAETTVAQLTSVWTSVGNSGDVFGGLRGNEILVLYEAFGELLLVIAMTIVVFLVLRRLAIPIFRRMGSRAEDVGIVRTFVLFLASVLMDVLVVVIAWAIGYAVTVLALGEFGQIGIRQTMYLNAFLLVELIKVAMRALLSPSAGGLRVLPLSDLAARRLNRHFNVIVSIIGYGQLLVVPILNQRVSFAAGNAISAILALIVLFYLVVLVIRNHNGVADWMQTRLAPQTGPEMDDDLGDPADINAVPADTRPPEPVKPGLMASLALHWHWFMLGYLGFMFFIVMTQPAERIVVSLVASAKIALVLVLAALASALLSGIVGRGVRLPEEVSQKLPLLEPRLNRVVPRALILLRYLIVLVVALFALDTIGIIPLRSWMESQIGFRLTSTIISVTMILAVSYCIWLAMTSWVDYRLNPDYGNVATARETTLLTLMRNAGTIALIILSLMFCLSEIGLDIGPLLASAGVLGLAIGFGAQKMVQDIITGIFIQFENAINVGDVITVGSTTGTVEKLTIRSVSLRDVQGVFHLIPFSSVDMVSNYTRDFSYFVCDMGVAYRENVEEVKQAMVDSFEQLIQDPELASVITADLEWFGLQSFGDSAVVLRARIKTLPGKQWSTGRAYNGVLKEVFDARGIEIPFPHQTIFFGEAKDGSTQPIRVVADKSLPDAQQDDQQDDQYDAPGEPTPPDAVDYDHEGSDVDEGDEGPGVAG